MSAEGFLLTPANLPDYLAARGLLRRGERVAVHELGGGVSNIVLLVEPSGDETGSGGHGGPVDEVRRWVVKQSLGKLRVKDDWRSDRARIFREAEAIQTLRPVLGDAVPEVIHVDRENYLFAMTAAPKGSVAWKEQLLDGRSEPTVAGEAGRLLARIIRASRADNTLPEKFGDRAVFDQLRVDPYYRTTASRHPDAAAALGELIADSWKIRTALVHGDYSPKNMLVLEKHVFLIDFEVIHWGDPAFDSGFLLNHLFLKAFHQPAFAERYVDAVRAFWQTLSAGLGLGPQAAGEFEQMTLRHLGGLMLARIDGKSPVEYIQDETTKRKVRRVAKRILLERPARIEDAVGLVLGEIRAASQT